MKLFVYGSLKRAFSNHHFLEGQSFIADAQTAPAYRMYDYGGFPALVSSSNDGVSIQGELWDVSERCLQQLDYLEGVDEGLYERSIAKLLPPYDREPNVTIYLYLRDVSRLPDIGENWRRELDLGP